MKFADHRKLNTFIQNEFVTAQRSSTVACVWVCVSWNLITTISDIIYTVFVVHEMTE